MAVDYLSKLAYPLSHDQYGEEDWQEETSEVEEEGPAPCPSISPASLTGSRAGGGQVTCSYTNTWLTHLSMSRDRCIAMATASASVSRLLSAF